MKYLIIITLILFSCNSKENRIPEIKEKPKRVYGGKVKKIITYICDEYYSNENIDIIHNSCKLYNITEFNEEEVEINSLSWYDLDYPLDPTLVVSAKLNSSGLVVEKNVNKTGPYGFNYRTIYSYNENDFLTEMISFDKGELSFRDEYIHDEYNCVIKQTYFNNRNELKYYYINEFDSKNRKTSSKKFNKDGIVEEVVKYLYKNNDKEWSVKNTYNDKGELIKKVDKDKVYKSNTSSITDKLPNENYSDIEYYANKKIKSWHYKNNDNDVYQTYDENGRIIERKIYDNDEWVESYSWKYREDNALLEKSESTSKYVDKNFYNKTTYFKVDFNGNYIEKYAIDSEGNIFELEIREIEYY